MLFENNSVIKTHIGDCQFYYTPNWKKICRASNLRHSEKLFRLCLNDPKKLLDNLFNFDRDNIPETVIQKITSYMDREDFDPAAIKRASIACEAMCMWTRAMFKYH